MLDEDARAPEYLDSVALPVNNYLTEIRSGSEAGSYSRRIDCLIALNSRLESNQEEEEEEAENEEKGDEDTWPLCETSQCSTRMRAPPNILRLSDFGSTQH